jgi:hypothetical protein
MEFLLLHGLLQNHDAGTIKNLNLAPMRFCGNDGKKLYHRVVGIEKLLLTYFIGSVQIIGLKFQE